MMEYMLIMLVVAFGAITAVRHLGQVAQQQTATMAQELAGVDTGSNAGPGAGDAGTGGDLPGSDFNGGGGNTGGGTNGGSGDGGNGGSGSGGNGDTGSGSGGGGGEDTPPDGPGGSGGGMSPSDLLACLKKKTKSQNEKNKIDVEKVVYEKFRKYEGDEPEMYLDTKNKITVGIGNMLTGKVAAKNLDFYIKVKNKQTGKTVERLATDKEIDAAVDALLKQPQSETCLNADTPKEFQSCNTASYYADLKGNSVYRHEDDRIKLAKAEIKDFGGKLEDKDLYPKFDSYPDKVKLALYDMIFNLGKAGLRDTFDNFTKAVQKRDWGAAAKESKRNGIQASRNAYVKNLLEEAATTKEAHIKTCSAAKKAT